MHDSSTIAANLSVAVVGKPTWPLISDIESIYFQSQAIIEMI